MENLPSLNMNETTIYHYLCMNLDIKLNWIYHHTEKEEE